MLVQFNLSLVSLPNLLAKEINVKKVKLSEKSIPFPKVQKSSSNYVGHLGISAPKSPFIYSEGFLKISLEERPNHCVDRQVCSLLNDPDMTQWLPEHGPGTTQGANELLLREREKEGNEHFVIDPQSAGLFIHSSTFSEYKLYVRVSTGSPMPEK